MCYGNTSQNITFPTSIKADQIGTYTLDAEASKTGYKTIAVKELFGVIEQEANIPYTTMGKPEPTPQIPLNYLPYAGIGVAVIVIIVLALFFIRKGRRQGKEQVFAEMKKKLKQ